MQDEPEEAPVLTELDREEGELSETTLADDEARSLPDGDVLGDPNVGEQEPDEPSYQGGSDGLSYDEGTSGGIGESGK